MASRWFEAAFGAHYPLLYAHRDDAEARRCLDLLPHLAPLVPADTPATADNLVLDLGCGDGRHLMYLHDLGIPAVGLDLSAALLARAVERGLTGSGQPLVRGDMARLPFMAGEFSAVLSLFTAFGYFGPLARNAGVVAEVSRVLKKGGHWFLDYFDCHGVRRELASERVHERVRELGPMTVRETRRLHDDGDQVCKDVELLPVPGQQSAAADWGIPAVGLRYTEAVALFELADLDDLAAAHGLRRVAGAGGYDGSVLGQGDRWLLVYRGDGLASTEEAK